MADDDRRTHAQDCPLAGHAQPQVTVVEHEVDPVLLERQGVLVGSLLDDLHGLHADLEPAGDARGARVGAHLSGNDHRGFLRDAGKLVEQILVQVVLESHALREPVAIPHQQEDQLALMRAVVHPAVEADHLTGMVGDLVNSNGYRHKLFLLGYGSHG